MYYIYNMAEPGFSNIDEFKIKYLELLDIVINHGRLENVEKIINFRDGIDNDDLNLISSKFIKQLEKSKKVKKLFLIRNERVFSNKNSVKLIPSVNLKTVLASLKDNIKTDAWNCIQLLYAIYRSGDENQAVYINELIGKIEESQKIDNSENKIVPESENQIVPESENQIVPVSENSEKQQKPTSKQNKVDNILMDIANTIKKNLVNISEGKTTGNPLQNLMKDAQKMTQKYSQDVQSGEISPMDLLGSVGKIAKQMDKDIDVNNDINTDNFKDMIPNLVDSVNNMAESIESEEGKSPNNFNMDGIKKIMPEFQKILQASKDGKIGEGNIDIMGMIDKMGEMFSGKKKDEKLTEEQIKEMQEFYQNLSTKDIEGLENINKEEEENKGGGIGGVIKGLMGSKEGGEGGIGGVLKGMMGGKEGGIGGVIKGLMGGKEGGIGNVINDLVGGLQPKNNEIKDNVMNEVD